MRAKAKSSTSAEQTTVVPSGAVEVAGKPGRTGTRRRRKTSSKGSSGSRKRQNSELSISPSVSKTSSVGFDEASFNKFYPQEEGLIEARKRLLFSADEAYNDMRNIQWWWALVAHDPELSFYVSLLGENIVEHIGMFTWFPLR